MVVVLRPEALPMDGGVEIFVERNGATDWDVRWSLDVAGATGYTSLTTVTGSQDFARFSFANDPTKQLYFWVKDHSDSTWVACYRPAYACATRFVDMNGNRTTTIKSNGKTILASSSGTNANDGLATARPKNGKWANDGGGSGLNAVFNSTVHGDRILFKCGDTFLNQAFNWAPSGSGAISADEYNVACYGDFSLGRPKFTGAGDSLIPFNLSNTDNRPRLMLQDLDITIDITARRNYFFTNNTTGQFHCIQFQAQHVGSNVGGGIDWIFEGLHLRYGSFGLLCTGNNGSTVETARITGLTINRCWIGDCYDYGISGNLGNGGPHNPSGVLLHAIDNLSITESFFPRCGFSSAADPMFNFTGAVQYDNGGGGGVGRVIDSGAAFVMSTITVVSATSTSVTVAAASLPGTNTMLNGWITFTSGVNNGQTKKISANTNSSITWVGAIGTAINGDTLTCTLSMANRMVDVGGLQKLVASVPDLTHLVLNEPWTANGATTPSNGAAGRACWSTPSIFRHGLYIQDSCTNILIDNCYFSEMDCMPRSGATVQNSLFAMMSIGLAIPGVQYSSFDGSVLSIQPRVVQRCGFDGFREVIDKFSGGQIAFLGDSNAVVNNAAVTFSENIIYGDPIASEPMSRFAGGGVNIQLRTGQTATTATVVDNYVQTTNSFLVVDYPAAYTGLWTFRRNVCSMFANGFGALVLSTRNNSDWVPGGGQSVGANNLYSTAGDGHLFNYGGSDRTNAAWNTKSGDSGSTYPGSPLLPTSKRRLTDYCTFRGISATRAAYEAQVETLWGYNWNPIWTARYVVDYMRAGAVNAVAAFATAIAPPDAPTIGVASNPTNTTLDVSWTDTTSYNETGFDAGISTDGVNFSIVSNIGGIDAVSATLTGLNANTLYYIKVRAHNAAGNSAWSGVVTGTTTVIVTPPPPNLQVPGILIVGDYMVNGGSVRQKDCLDAKVTAGGASEIRSIYADKVMRVVPDNPSTGAPTAAALGWYPWFDGLNGTALFLVNAGGTDTTHLQATGSPGWTVNQFAGEVATVVNSVTPGYGLGFFDRVLITSNTANTLTLAAPMVGTPDGTNQFFIGGNNGSVARGAWTDYHAVAGWLTLTETAAHQSSKRGGSSWGALGAGVGLDAGLIRELYENTYPAAPYFQVAKFFQLAPTYSAFDVATGSSKAAFAAQLAAMNAAWSVLANGNALFWDLLVLDNSQRDVNDWVANPAHQASYQSRVQETIAYFRTALGNPNLKVVLLNHAAEINNVASPSATTYANMIHRNVAAADAIGNVRCVSLEGQPLCLDVSVLYTPSENKGFYQANVYWQAMAKAVRQAYDLLIADDTATAGTGAVPAYLMLGDSIFRGPITPAYLDDLDSPVLTGTARDARQGIWDGRVGEGVAYDVSAANANTAGTFSNTAGPDCSILPALMNLHPATGCYVVKRAVDKSGLASAVTAYTRDSYPATPAQGGRWSKGYAENYPALQAEWRAFCRWVNLTLGKQVDLKGIFIDLGTFDQQVTGAGAVFAAQLAQFVGDLRSDFATRTSGAALPVVFRQPQLAASGALFTEAASIRTALQKLQAADSQFYLLNVDSLERSTVDSLSETPDASIEDGQRLVAALTKVAI